MSVEEVVGLFGIPDTNENGERLVQQCVERGLMVGNTYSKKRKFTKYTWVSEIKDTYVQCADQYVIQG